MALALIRPASAVERPEPPAQRSLLRAGTLQALTSAGQWATLVACQTYAAYRLGAGPGFLALLTLVSAAPLLVNRPLGKLVDRHGPLLPGLLGTAATAVFTVAAAWGAARPAGMLLFAAAIAASRAVAQAAVDAVPAWLPVPPSTARASVSLGLAQAAPLIAGSSVAVALTLAFGLTTTLLALAAVTVATSTVLATTRLRRPEPAQAGRLPGASGTPRLRPILLVAAATAASYAAVEALQPVYLHDVLHAPGWMLAVNDAAFGVSSCLCALLLMRVPHLVEHRAALPLAVLCVAASEIVLVSSSSAVIAALGNALWGLGVAVLAPATRTRVLARVPAERHGAAMGAYRSWWAGATLLGATTVGPLAEGVGAQWALVTAALLLAATSTLTTR